MSNKPVRFLVAAIGPPLIASIFALVLVVVNAPQEITSIQVLLERFMVLAVFAFYFAGVQSLVFAILINFVIPRISADVAVNVIFGFLYGYVAGQSVVYFLSEEIVVFSSLGLLGAVIGALTSSIILWLRGQVDDESTSHGKLLKWRPKRPVFMASLCLGILSLIVIDPGIDGGIMLTGPVYLFVFTLPWYIVIRLMLMVMVKGIARENLR